MQLEALIELLAVHFNLELVTAETKSSKEMNYLNAGFVRLATHHHISILGPAGAESISSLVNGLLSLENGSSILDPTSRAWRDFLCGNSLILPKEPFIQSDRPCRIIHLCSPDSTIGIDLIELAKELLMCTPLIVEENKLYFYVSDSPALSEALTAFYETATLELGLRIILVLSPVVPRLDELSEAYSILPALFTKAEKSSGPVIFEHCVSDLLFEEWLSNAQGPVTRAVQRMDLSLLDDELLRTIDTLFKMNLNLTETAKALFIHRNTLIYRLDKLERQLGFDLRRFEDSLKLSLLLKTRHCL